jgi:D-threo-aldose 1-dehydrogenase
LNSAASQARQRALGASAVTVGPLGFGAVPLGNLYRAMPESEAAATVRAAVDGGLRYFDTAPLYGLGLSERRLGIYLRDLPRDAFVLSSKVGRRLHPGRSDDAGIFVDAPQFTEAFDFSYDGIMRQFEDSLQRLGVERLDCVVIHDIGLWHMKEAAVVDHHFHALESSGLKALQELRRVGRIRAIGAGANELTLCDRYLGLDALDFVLLALRYSLLDQSGRAFIEAARRRNLGVVVGAPFQSGILAEGDAASGHYNYGEAPSRVLERVRRLKALCADHRVPLKAAALQFPIQNPGVASVLAGMGSPGETRENIAMATAPIPAALWADLDELERLD